MKLKGIYYKYNVSSTYRNGFFNMHSSSFSPINVILKKDNKTTETYISAKHRNILKNEGVTYDCLTSCSKGARSELVSEVT